MTDTIITGNCMDVLKTMEPNSVDLILTDPPYGITNNKWDALVPMEDTIEVAHKKRLTSAKFMDYAYKKGMPRSEAIAMWKEQHTPGLWSLYRRVLKTNGVIAITSAEPFTSMLISTNPKQFRYRWTWKKRIVSGPGFAHRQPMRRIEDICVFYDNGSSTYHPQMYTGPAYSRVRKAHDLGTYKSMGQVTYTNRTERFPSDLLELDDAYVPTSGRYHRTQKPLSLGRYLVRTYTDPGQVVLDNCCGSGSFPLAAHLEGRRYIGIEIDPEFAEIARQRIENATIPDGQLTLFG